VQNVILNENLSKFYRIDVKEESHMKPK